jgi:thioredoxin-dependent peroxiredoxin
MNIERKGLASFGGIETTVVGADIQVGEKAPEFTVQAGDWSLVNALESTRGKVRIIGSLPSLNTSVCDRETRRFNQEATALDENIVIIMVSTDLPLMAKSWCAAAGVDKVLVLSDHLDTNFGQSYGVLMKELRILRRAVFVVDAGGVVVYADYMASAGDEPNYEAVLSAARAALKS